MAAFWAFILLLLMQIVVGFMPSPPPMFTFTEFPYKETTKNELAFREYEAACEQTPSCVNIKGIHRGRCVRECISPSCYLDIYRKDELEEGEIDVRLSSFKGCFVQRVSRQRP